MDQSQEISLGHAIFTSSEYRIIQLELSHVENSKNHVVYDQCDAVDVNPCAPLQAYKAILFKN